MPSCDLLIPVYNGALTLPLTLQALTSQKIPPHWLIQVVVCDDGSTDNSAAVASSFKKTFAWPMSILPGSHQGSGKARNRGVMASGADITFFLGADIILLPGSLQAHLSFHENFPQATAGALGMVKWDPRLKPSPLMEWMTHGGTQNNFDQLLCAREAHPAHFFYASHVSLKRSLLHNTFFNTEFNYYGWEDLELGRRLAKKGLKLTPLQQAIGLHHHYYPASRIKARQKQLGQGLVRYQQLHPRTELIPERSVVHSVVRRLLLSLGLPPILYVLVWLTQALNISAPRLFARFTAAYHWVGVTKVTKVLPKKSLFST